MRISPPSDLTIERLTALPDISVDAILQDPSLQLMKLAHRPKDEWVFSWLERHARSVVVLHVTSTPKEFSGVSPFERDEVYLVLDSGYKFAYSEIETTRNPTAIMLTWVKAHQLPVILLETNETC